MAKTRSRSSRRAAPDQQESALLKSFLAPRASVASRLAAGKELRLRVPRASHAEYKPARTRADPVAILQAQAKTRLPHLVPIRYARMLASPFAFLRGSAAVMAADLAATPTTGLHVQACGDAHVANFGVFATAERNLVFGIDDFDETYPGPWEWDLKRLAASAAVCARHLGAGKRSAEAAARSAVAVYRTQIHRYAEMGALAVWYARIEEAAVLRSLSPQVRARAQQILAKARQRTNLQMLEKMVDLVDDRFRLIQDRPMLVRESRAVAGDRPIHEALDLFLHSYLKSLPWDRRLLVGRYQLVDVARKVAGVGSVGMRCWVILFRGVDDGDPLFLQVKEAQPSVLAPYSPVKAPFAEEGERVVTGQRMIQGAPDIFLGWASQDGIQLYARQLRDTKGGIALEPGKTKVRNFIEYCGLCGWALALAHAKSGDPAMIAGYIGNSDALDTALASFAALYADQTESDFAALRKAARNKRIKVAEEVR